MAKQGKAKGRYCDIVCYVAAQVEQGGEQKEYGSVAQEGAEEVEEGPLGYPLERSPAGVLFPQSLQGGVADKEVDEQQEKHVPPSDDVFAIDKRFEAQVVEVGTGLGVGIGVVQVLFHVAHD